MVIRLLTAAASISALGCKKHRLNNNAAAASMLHCRQQRLSPVKLASFSSNKVLQKSLALPCSSSVTDYELSSAGRSRATLLSSSCIYGAVKVLVACFITWIVSANSHSGVAYAAATSVASSESIAASSLGLQIADFLRKSGWADEAVVFFLATLPVLELRGAIPVGHWLQLDPLKVYLLSVAGNMLPVPLVLLYLDKVSKFLSERSSSGKKFLDSIYRSTRNRAGPIEEFKWLGLMLFVAVPFPGTGAWTGAIASVILGMPFWSSFWANFFGVAIAGILVELLVNMGLRSAILVGAALFTSSTFMWGLLRFIRTNSLSSS